MGHRTLYTMTLTLGKETARSPKVSLVPKANCAKYHVSITFSFLLGSKNHFRLLRAITGTFWGLHDPFSNSSKILTQTMFLSSLGSKSREGHQKISQALELACAKYPSLYYKYFSLENKKNLPQQCRLNWKHSHLHQGDLNTDWR